MPRVFQLDQLGAAVLSPVRAAVKNQEEAVRASEIGERAQFAALIGEGEIRDSFTRLRAGLVVIVGGLKVFGVQLGRDGLASRAQPAEFAHDGGFFSQISGYLVAPRHFAYSTADAVSIPDELFQCAEHLARRTGGKSPANDSTPPSRHGKTKALRPNNRASICSYQ
jgi:hypothetical protein